MSEDVDLLSDVSVDLLDGDSVLPPVWLSKIELVENGTKLYVLVRAGTLLLDGRPMHVVRTVTPDSTGDHVTIQDVASASCKCQAIRSLWMRDAVQLVGAQHMAKVPWNGMICKDHQKAHEARIMRTNVNTAGTSNMFLLSFSTEELEAEVQRRKDEQEDQEKSQKG